MPRPTTDPTSAPSAPSAPEGADSTRERIVAAATEEFARHGIAGARVDRIAKQARTSKERVYAHFRGKEALYAHVSLLELARVAQATPMDPDDLPGYAGRLYDHFTITRPDHHRLITWGRLELAGTAASSGADAVRETVAGKIDQLREAQRAGRLDPAWDPVDVLALVNQIATTWAAQTEIGAVAAERAADPSLAARRAAVVAAVERLFPRVTR
ncbi:TetR family transcriptional regulator [Streptomyces caniscabiei]|uniref:TetR family transcriptional regulator n=1 Tax=Streptomyces caniscabiei TaxID=2746961 RepID=UPI0029A30B6C|nr:TetR family transcriptional regulator [Streptomyces caniscabiei]MDX2604434.1 TetR family transcriptional regulator [Streptomyces caniscabiei]MDX2735776.1 TetR family transcriptional regulator [Streptomyces caniscabiei]MDX2782396.1 TetR family transcriptional regulator [Streptomyces caniscabiei]